MGRGGRGGGSRGAVSLCPAFLLFQFQVGPGIALIGSSTRPRQMQVDSDDEDDDVDEGSVSGGEEYADLVSATLSFWFETFR
jgi:hypothetical protein